MQRFLASALTAAFAVLLSAAVVSADGIVSVHAPDKRLQLSTHECKVGGHQIEYRNVTIDSGAVRYGLQYSGCTDPSHEGRHPSSEGNFGMPQPVPGNWYWGGFMRVLINGLDATLCDLTDWRAIETGQRGVFQVRFAHPDADVTMRFMMLPGGNHLMTDLRWSPREGAALKTVTVELRCYPSFFTAARHRDGARRCRTPRTEAVQGAKLQIAVGEDGWLYYYDEVFDVARGEGDGPCAALAAPEGLIGGSVDVGSYAVNTLLDYDPAAGRARLGFYDFTGKTNAQAGDYLAQNGARDLAELIAADFRPSTVQTLDVAAMRAEATRLLTDAGDDADRLRKQVEDLVDKIAALKAGADAGDMGAEADIGAQIEASADLFWKLRAFAVLNNPGE